MSRDIKLSVIMLVCKEVNAIREAVNRLMNVEIDKEIIIVDDGSPMALWKY